MDLLDGLVLDLLCSYLDQKSLCGLALMDRRLFASVRAYRLRHYYWDYHKTPTALFAHARYAKLVIAYDPHSIIQQMGPKILGVYVVISQKWNYSVQQFSLNEERIERVKADFWHESFALGNIRRVEIDRAPYAIEIPADSALEVLQIKSSVRVRIRGGNSRLHTISVCKPSPDWLTLDYPKATGLRVIRTDGRLGSYFL